MNNEGAFRLAVGIGCDRGTSAITLRTALNQALASIGIDVFRISRLASIDLKANEAGLLALARELDQPLLFFSAAQLAAVPVPNPSETVRRHIGTPSVSEAAALLAARAHMADLLVEKHKWRGSDGRNATISIARMPHD